MTSVGATREATLNAVGAVMVVMPGQRPAPAALLRRCGGSGRSSDAGRGGENGASGGASGGAEPVTCTLAPTLPTGLIFNAADLTITGTPSGAAVPIGITHTATDVGCVSVMLSFSRTVKALVAPVPEPTPEPAPEPMPVAVESGPSPTPTPTTPVAQKPAAVPPEPTPASVTPAPTL